MAFYERLASRWHQITGTKGGALKEHVLNKLMLDRIPAVGEKSILELAAGNGYFMPLVIRRFSGQVPGHIVITDQSKALLAIAEKHFPVQGAEYRVMDVRRKFPFSNASFDLIMANMLFNELTDTGLAHALKESRRVLGPRGRLVASAVHPKFVGSLSKRGQLRKYSGFLTMPGTKGLRLPIVRRSEQVYGKIFAASGLEVEWKDVFPSEKVLSAKPGLRKAGRIPLAFIVNCKLCSEIATDWSDRP